MKTTFSRAFFPAALVLLSALLLVGMFLRALVNDYLTDQTVASLESDASAISELATAYYSEGSLTSREFFVNLSIAAQVSDSDAVILNKQGRVVLCSDSPLSCEHQGWQMQPAYVQRVFRDGKAVDSGVTSNLYEDIRYMVSIPIMDYVTETPIGIVMVSSPMTATQVLLEKISDIYLFVSILVVLAAVVIMSVFARQQSVPLREMSHAANAFAHGDLDARVPLRRNYTREVEDLTLAFNNMASSLQKSEYQRQEFVANVSHELKTPMTTIGGYVDGMLDGTIPPERQRHYMQIVSDETKRLSRLVRSMLDISRLQDQGGIPEDKKTRFDLEECIGTVLITFEKKIIDKQLDVQVNWPEYPVFTYACRDYIIQVIYNLIDNAVKFCPQSGVLGVSLRESGNKIYVSVSNDGNTIPAEELPLVFDRFHKLDKSRSQNREGWGLGLYIVKTIICSHGENISVSSRDGKTEFTFTLPATL